MLEQLDKHDCYWYFDSVVYIENDETKAIVNRHIGDGLGQWTEELVGNHIEFWCCAQAKDDSYILNNGKHAGKVEGLRVTSETENKMKNEQRRQLIKGAINYVVENYTHFAIKHCEIITRSLVK